jgi:hypothetical protein
MILRFLISQNCVWTILRAFIRLPHHAHFNSERAKGSRIRDEQGPLEYRTIELPKCGEDEVSRQHQEHRGVPYRPPCVDYERELLFKRYPALRRFDEALKVSQAKPGQWVAISGAGGGHLAVQYAVAMGLRMT